MTNRDSSSETVVLKSPRTPRINSPRKSAAPASPSGDSNTQYTSEELVPWHSLHSAEIACQLLETDPESGITPRVAEDRLHLYGRNALTPPPKASLLMRIWAQVNNILVLILIAAAVVSGILEEWAEVGLIAGVSNPTLTTTSRHRVGGQPGQSSPNDLKRPLLLPIP
jgi:magnesium-transporting ATPase (P-type)